MIRLIRHVEVVLVRHTNVVFNFSAVDKKKKAIERLEEQLMKLEVQATDKVIKQE